MIHARLGIAEENSGRLVALVREEARKRVLANRIDLLLTDGPPGIGCPVIASMGQSSAVLIVTEPTVSGIHDMERVAQLAAHFKLPAMICINKYDLNPDQAKAIEAIAEKRNIDFMGKIPFDPAFTKAMVQGKSIMETHADSPAARQIKQIWERVMGHPAMKMDRLC
jgi:MinD superfamily P-loop ATPase